MWVVVVVVVVEVEEEEEYKIGCNNRICSRHEQGRYV